MDIEETDHELLSNILAKVVAGFLEEQEAIWVEWDDFKYLVYYHDGELHVVDAEDDEDFEDLTKFRFNEIH